MKQLNFFPFYEPYLRTHQKTTTLRLSNRASLAAGDEVVVTIGWDGATARPLGRARITEIRERRIGDLTEAEFAGESPDCRSTETVKLVLGCIYRRVVTDRDSLFVIKFEHLEDAEP